MKKRIVALLTALCLVVGLIPAVAAEDVTSGTWDNISWTITDGVLTISGEGDMAYEIDGDHLYNHLYPYSDDTVKIVVEEGITSLCPGIFSDFRYAAEVSLPSTLRKIDRDVFINCYGLNEIIIPANVTELGNSVFAYNWDLAVRFTGDAPKMKEYSIVDEEGDWGTLSNFHGTIYYPGNNPTWTEAYLSTNYGDGDIIWQPYFTSGSCGENLTWRIEGDTLYIEGEGDMYDYSLEEPAPWYGMDFSYLEIDPGVTSIGSMAFYECYDLCTGDFYNTSITHIGSMAFASTGLTSVTLPKGLTEIPDALFFQAYGLTYVYIPDSVTSIGSSAFTWTEVEELLIPDSVTKVGNCAFDSIPGPVYFTGDAPEFVAPMTQMEDGIAFGSFGYYCGTTYYPANNSTWNPDALSSDYYEMSVQFEPISGPCDMGEGLNASWNYDYETKTITVTGTGMAFPGAWDHLMNRAEHVVYEEGITDVLGGFVNGIVPNDTLRSATIPSTADYIESSAFMNCTALSDVTISEGVRVISGYVFSSCSALESITLPDTVTRIGNGAFSDCTSLKSINIPEGNTTIFYRLFDGCTSLETIELPSTITTIGMQAFANCTNLKEVYFNGNAPSISDQQDDMVNNSSFVGVTATCYYPMNNDTWTEDTLKDYGGMLTWIAYDPNNPFMDVPAGSFYAIPVAWAVEKNITNGLTSTEFGPTAVCNRAQVVTFLYRAFESPAVNVEGLPFTDVPAGAWYEAPIAWAVENGVTNGLTATEFGPNSSCNRAQVVTFLYRAYN